LLKNVRPVPNSPIEILAGQREERGEGAEASIGAQRAGRAHRGGLRDRGRVRVGVGQAVRPAEADADGPHLPLAVGGDVAGERQGLAVARDEGQACADGADPPVLLLLLGLRGGRLRRHGVGDAQGGLGGGGLLGGQRSALGGAHLSGGNGCSRRGI
jgi:hypothetical protein